MGMAPRKRSYKGAGDKWLGVWLHNASVEDHREGRTKAARNERLASIRTKLSGEGIDESWAEVTLGIMDSDGYGLNQFSNRVLPVLRDRMSACARKEDRKARAGELRNIDARRRKEAVAEARKNEAHCRNGRRELTSGVKTSTKNAKKVTWFDPGFDIGEAKNKALAATLADLSADIRLAKTVLDNPFSSIHEIRLAVSKSLFLDYTWNGFFKCIAWLGFDVLVVYMAFNVIEPYLKNVDPNHGPGHALALVAFIGVLAVPILVIRHLVWLAKPRLRLSMAFLKKRYQSHFLSNATGQRVLPPAIEKSDITQSIISDMKEIELALRSALKKRSA
jgi:hypothetical protein